MSSIRRKPQSTYPSPPASDSNSTPCSPWMLPRPITTHSPPKSLSHASSSHSEQPSASSEHRSLATKYKRPSVPSLPLYHPLGSFALSLPPLNPVLFGFPADVCIDDDEGLPGTLREAAMKPQPPDSSSETPSIAAIAAAADREVRELVTTTSPRKKRGGGGGKRKRKDHDESDTTYPAKKTRQSATLSSHRAHESVELIINTTNISTDSIVTPEPPAAVNAVQERGSKRRSKRSSMDPMKSLRSSEESSGSASLLAPVRPVTKQDVDMIVEKLVQVVENEKASAAKLAESNAEQRESDAPQAPPETTIPTPPPLPVPSYRRIRSRSKEEGEISEEEKQPT